MLRHYYVTKDVNAIVETEQELIDNGISHGQIHVVTDKEGEVERYQQTDVLSIGKLDVVHSAFVGAIVGLIGSISLLMIAYLFNWHQAVSGWLPLIFSAALLFGFCVWEGGLIGMQSMNVHFKRFNHMLKQGKHVFFVDVEEKQEAALDKVMPRHPQLVEAGTEGSFSSWFVHIKR